MKKNNIYFIFIVTILVLILSILTFNVMSKINKVDLTNNANIELDYSKVPYISTYYFESKPSVNEDIIIPFYITDYDQSEYLYNNNTISLNLEYEVDGIKNNLNNLQAGDNSLNLGKLSEGEHYFSLQAIDTRTGLKSHKLYNELLVVNPDKYNITTEETYNITELDLSKYKISNKNSTNVNDMENTRIGLTKLFLYLQSKGFRKCVLPKGIYRINNIGRYDSISIPNNFTVDMNGSTFKLDTILENDKEASIVNMNNTYDSHLINGILEGDRSERDVLGLNTGYNGEPINTIIIKGGKYSSIEDLTIKQTTGHTVGSSSVNLGTPQYFSEFNKYLIIDGKEINNSTWSTTEMINISELISTEYLTIGRYLGYRGVVGDCLTVYINFYDQDEEFLETVVGYQYRKTKIPNNSKYIRVSLLGDITVDDKLGVYYNELGTNWTYKNIDFIDTRTTSIATSTCNNLLIDNCTFTRCGKSITPSLVDFEDGWQECQDVYFRNCHRIGESIGTADIIDNSGYNHVYENNDNIGYVIRYSVVGLVIRNNDNMMTSRWHMGYETGSKFTRIQNNTINGSFNTGIVDGDGVVISQVKDSKINCTDLNYIESSINNFSYERCDIYNFNAKNIRALNCNIYPSPYLWENLYFKNCTFYPLNDETKIKMSFNAFDTYREFNNCVFTTNTELVSHNKFNNGIFNNCIFEGDVVISPNKVNKDGDLQFNNCTFNGNVIINIKDTQTYINFNNCYFNKETNFSDENLKELIKVKN